MQDDLHTTPAPSRPLDARLIRAAFLDLLGRPPFRSERGTWRGRGLHELLDEILGSTDFWENWLEEQLYYFLLVDNFRPTSDRVQAIPDDLASGRIGVRDALHRIVISASFDRRNPGPDTFVTVVMEQLLGTTVQRRPRELELGKRMYDGARANFLGNTGHSQADVLRIAIEDRQAMRHFVEREYGRMLRAEPDASKAAAWAKRLAGEGDEAREVLRDWFSSDAYTRRLENKAPLPNRVFVRALYVDLTDRLPDDDEAQRLRNALDGLADAGPLRSVLARLLLDSGTAPVPEKEAIEDPTAWVAGLFERLLGRAASAEELRTFVAAFHAPACQPTTVVYAIVSHPEYQTW